MSSSVMSRYVQRVQNISFLAELPIMFGMLSFKGTNRDTDKHLRLGIGLGDELKISLLLITFLIACAISKGSGEPAHPRSLVRAFAVRIHKINLWMETQAIYFI